ncbi:hydrolase 1, exosortase A system-associated [Novosphingobium lentum]|uniref:hydrolase 1, exosortase A system-associated n=1 Tax=Novosphingobium lentum TaxID=145287 RepID=UPI000830B1A4|nr:hydrolase 1, exosortase A system-associated [Novosphingobium lentum]
MSRRHFTFDCEGVALAATVDPAAGLMASRSTGLLLVSGGNEVRSGSWAGQAQLAARLAAAGFPVLRFDRRGVGDSDGENRGFRDEQADIAAALAAFRTEAPGLDRIVAFGNCDAASALALGAPTLALDALVLANPWTIEATDEPAEGDAPALSAAAVRQRYLAKLTNPREIWRLLSGGVNLAKLARGLRAAATPAAPSSLAGDMQAGLAGFSGPVTILLAEGDRTAQAFIGAWPKGDQRVRRIASASHSFSDDAARDWLFDRLLEALRSA